MAEPGVRRPSIRDVAAAAGVSYQTVSRVLNEPALVRPSTAERVQRVIKELGYRPSKAARSLVRRDSTTIGAVGIHDHLIDLDHRSGANLRQIAHFWPGVDGENLAVFILDAHQPAL